MEDVDQIPKYIQSGNWKKALKIVKRHHFGLSKAEIRHIELALEFLNGKEGFYKQLGVDCEKSLATAKAILLKKYVTCKL